MQLVWTSLEDLPSTARETSVIVRNMCQARRRVLVANFAFDRPRSRLLRPLADNMADNLEFEAGNACSSAAPMSGQGA